MARDSRTATERGVDTIPNLDGKFTNIFLLITVLNRQTLMAWCKKNYIIKEIHPRSTKIRDNRAIGDFAQIAEMSPALIFNHYILKS